MMKLDKKKKKQLRKVMFYLKRSIYANDTNLTVKSV